MNEVVNMQSDTPKDLVVTKDEFSKIDYDIPAGDEHIVVKKQYLTKLGIKKLIFTLATIIAVILGIGIGYYLRTIRKWTKREVMYVEFPGELFLRSLRMLILPLIFSSLVHALGSLDSSLSGKIGLRALLYYFLTTVLSIFQGIAIVIAIKPGVAAENMFSDDDSTTNFNSTTEDALLDLLRNLLPPNLVEATFRQVKTVLVLPKNASADTPISEWDYKFDHENNTNFLGVVFFGVLLGLALCRMKKKARPLLAFFGCLSNATMELTKMLILMSPIGIMFLVMGRVMSIDDFQIFAGRVGLYFVTVITGLSFHSMITLPLIYFLVTRKNPYIFIWKLSDALITAFATSSSSATLAITINCLEEKLHIDSRLTRFMLPIGATINMDGTALYEAVAAIFIAQAWGIELPFYKLIVISITATAASIGAAGIPQAGLVTMLMVLRSAQLPTEGIALIIIVDWLLDRFRTSVNVLGDSFGTGILAALCSKFLDPIPSVEEMY